MSLFNRKETIVLKSEQQKDAYIERLEKAHVEYDVFEDRDNIYSRDVLEYNYSVVTGVSKYGRLDYSLQSKVL